MLVNLGRPVNQTALINKDWDTGKPDIQVIGKEPAGTTAEWSGKASETWLLPLVQAGVQCLQTGTQSGARMACRDCGVDNSP